MSTNTEVSPGEEITDKASRTNRTIQEVKAEGRKRRLRYQREMEKDLDHMLSPESEIQSKVPVLQYDVAQPSECGKSVGLVYNNDMLKHCTRKTLDYGGHYPERPDRILKPLERLNETDTLSRLYLMSGREATLEEIWTVHLADHTSTIASIVKLEQDELEVKQEQYDSVYLCGETYRCALLSCGSTLSIVDMVVRGSLKSGFALVRPPGHHAEAHTARGFCIFNNVAIAAIQAQALAKKIGIVSDERKYKVLILDWDVHHGNGTQNKFYDDASVLYISLHRYEHGYFYPSSEDANHDRIGVGEGAGYNINIPWSGAKMGDGEYYLAFEKIIMPVAKDFDPHLVLVSSGFDAGKGDPLGGFRVTPHMYGYMTHRLQSLAGGNVVVVLEGGYNLKTVSDSVLACTRALLDFAPLGTENRPNLEYSSPPKMKDANSAGIQCVLGTLKSICSYWPCLEENMAEMEEIEESKRMSVAEKLSQGLETLSLHDQAVSGDGRQQHGTRTKSGSSNHSNASIVSSEESPECKEWEQLEFAPPGSLQPSAVEHCVETDVSAPKLSLDYSDASDTLPGELSFHSSHSTTWNDHSRPSSENKVSDENACFNPADSAANPDLLGACGGGAEKPDVQQLTIVLNSMGMGNVSGMSLEDMVAIAQAGLPDDASGYTVPKDDCPHVKLDYKHLFNAIEDWELHNRCEDCGHASENWSCLSCGQVFCGRFVNGHMLEHSNLSKHPITLSHTDLSFWCYQCDSYLSNYSIKTLKEVYKKVHLLKHGMQAPI